MAEAYTFRGDFAHKRADFLHDKRQTLQTVAVSRNRLARCYRPIGMIALLATIVLVAINPGRQFAQARNAQRESHVNTILNALGQHLADNKGVAIAASNCTGLSTVPDETPRQIGTGAVNLGCLVPTYLPTAIPVDPTGGTAADTLYTITASTSGRYTICAPLHAEAAISGSAAYCLSR